MRDILKKFILKLGPKMTRMFLLAYHTLLILRYRKVFSEFIKFRGIELKVGKDVSIFPSLYKGTYEKFELDLLLGYGFKSDTVFWDVGANIGIYSILFSKMQPSWKIFAFEPNREVEKLLKENISRNRSQNIEIVTLALSDKASIALLKLNRHRAGGNNLIDSSSNGSRVLKVTTAKGDELVTLNKIPRPDLIKIDCEGHELKILIGLADTIFHYKPIILIEILKDNWVNSQSFISFITYLDSLINIYGNAILIKNNKSYNITQIDSEDLDNSLQTLVLGLI
jgi:FkbM family methyltransferase